MSEPKFRLSIETSDGFAQKALWLLIAVTLTILAQALDHPAILELATSGQ